MNLDRQTYLRDTDDNDVQGLVVLETDGDEYRITENRDGQWCKPFWVDADWFDAHETERVGNLSSEQFLKVCRVCGLNE